MTSEDADSQTALTLVPVEEFIVRASMTVAQLREYIFHNWLTITGSQSSNVPKPASQNHIRIRDGKVSLYIDYIPHINVI
jgi:hypothetical protein